MRILSESYNNGYGSGNGGNGNGAPGSGNNSGNGNNGNGGNGNRPPRRPSILMMILSGLMTVIAILMLYNAFFGTGNGTEVSYTDFLKDLEADKVEAVEVNKESGVITVQLKKEAAATPAPDSYVTFYGITQKATQSKTVYYTMLMEDLDTLTGRLQEHGVTGTRISSNTSSFLMEILVTVVLPVVLIWVVAGFLFRKMGGSGGPMGVGKSNAKVYVQKETGVTFKDVAGEDEAKESLVEVVDFLHNPQKYTDIGAKLPRLAGLDMVIGLTPYGKFPMMMDTFVNMGIQMLAPLGHIKPVFPMPGGGTTQGHIEDVIHKFGKDVMIAAGGAIHGHPMGPAAGARAFRQGIDAVCAGKSLEEAGKEYEELGVALKLWGIYSEAKHGIFDLKG